MYFWYTEGTLEIIAQRNDTRIDKMCNAVTACYIQHNICDIHPRMMDHECHGLRMVGLQGVKPANWCFRYS